MEEEKSKARLSIKSIEDSGVVNKKEGAMAGRLMRHEGEVSCFRPMIGRCSLLGPDPAKMYLPPLYISLLLFFFSSGAIRFEKER